MRLSDATYGRDYAQFCSAFTSRLHFVPARSMSEVVDVDHFRKTLEADVRIITREELPAGLRKKDTWQVAKKKYLGTPEVSWEPPTNAWTS